MTKKKNNNIPIVLRIISFLFPKLEIISPFLANRLAVQLFHRPFRFKPTIPEKKAAEQAEKFKIKINKKNIQVYTWGEGKPVLMVHGWSGRGTQFRKFIKPFNDHGLKVIAIDGPAHGKSEGNSAHAREFVETVVKLQEVYGEFESLIGHSFGGVVNINCVHYGVAVKKLILIASPTIAEDIIADFLKKINASAERGLYFKQWLFRKNGVHFEDASIYALADQIPDIPILVIHDEEDRDVPIHHAEVLKGKLPHIELYKTKGLGHLRILKDKAVINKCIDFIIGESSPEIEIQSSDAESRF